MSETPYINGGVSFGRAREECRIGACYVAAFSGLKGSKAMRYNKGISINSMFPTREKGRCAYCQGLLTGRQRRWCGYECERTAVTEFLIVKGDVGTIRKELYKRDGGKCAGCGAENCEWEADHITAVVNGGGGCDLSGVSRATGRRRERMSVLPALEPATVVFSLPHNYKYTKKSLSSRAITS